MNNISVTWQELPTPPVDKFGWPWSDINCMPMQKLDRSNYPKITVITPSYNQEQFLEATIRSVLLQNYPNLEYIIIDGGSTDNSVEIIRKYEKYLTYWVSEKDRGQSHAINKGFAKSSGDILCWLNSDDLLKPCALEFVAIKLPSTSIPAWLIGSSEIIDSVGSTINLRTPKNVSLKSILLWHINWFPQQSTFWNRSMWENAGNLDETLYYAMDFSLWVNMFKCSPPIVVEDLLACYRFQEKAKCLAQPSKAFAEILVSLYKHIKLTTKDIKFQYSVIEAIFKVACDYIIYQLKTSKVAKLGKKVYKKLNSI